MGATAANFVNIVALMLCVAWMCVALYPGHWHYEDVALFYKFNVGLYSVHVEKSVGSGIVDAGLSVVTKKFGMGESFQAVKAAVAESIEGHHYIAKTSETFCSLSGIPGLGNNLCQTWKNVQYSGWTALLFIGLCVLFLLLGVGFNYFFWNSKVTETGARWTLIFFWLAPLCALIGIGQYGVFTNEFSMNVIFQSSSVHTWDFSFFFASFLVGFSMIPALVTGLCSEMNKYVEYKIEGKEATYGSLEGGGQPTLDSDFTAGHAGGAGAPNYGSTMPPPPGGAAYGGGALPASGAPFFAGGPPQPAAFVAAGAAGGDKFVVVQAPAPAPGTGQAAW